MDNTTQLVEVDRDVKDTVADMISKLESAKESEEESKEMIAQAVKDTVDDLLTKLETDNTTKPVAEEKDLAVNTKTETEEVEKTLEKKSPSPTRRRLSDSLKDSTEPPSKLQKMEEKNALPFEIVQTLQQLATPKMGHNGLPYRPAPVQIVDGRPVVPEMEPLAQCQHLQQIQSLIHYHEQQVKYRSYMQLEILRPMRKQLSDQMMSHPHRKYYDAFVEAAKGNRLTSLSMAERAQLEYFNQMAEWTLEARAVLQNRGESANYLNLFGRQVLEYKERLNEITYHEQFQAFGPMFAERIDNHREMLHIIGRRSSVSIA